MNPNGMHCQANPIECRGESYCACQCEKCRAAHAAGAEYYAGEALARQGGTVRTLELVVSGMGWQIPDPSAEQIRSLKEECEQLQVQLAGCGVAALGGTQDPATPGMDGYSASYGGVLALRLKYDAALEQIRVLSAALRRSQSFLVDVCAPTDICDQVDEALATAKEKVGT